MRRPRSTQRNNRLTPLWVLSLFVSLTEVIVGLAVTKAVDGVQVALRAFVIGFPVQVFNLGFTRWEKGLTTLLSMGESKRHSPSPGELGKSFGSSPYEKSFPRCIFASHRFWSDSRSGTKSKSFTESGNPAAHNLASASQEPTSHAGTNFVARCNVGQ
jgi:hypothetical protein